ncbi:hypothetical protein A5686_10325 [Mycobacterium sp. E2479]|nr:hypothetical protein A5686_10325 [Mycobacterium sp. E2479]
MVGWSREFPAGEVRPLHYFSANLVAYRDDRGELHILEAHCKHLGVHPRPHHRNRWQKSFH